MSELGKAYVQIVPTTRNIKSALAKELDKPVDEQGKKSGESFGKVFSDAAGKALKVGKAITAAAATAMVAVTKQAISNFADYEQLVGGAQLMFGDAYDYIAGKAATAYSTVQMSQNDYLQQVNGFATGLKTALGGNEQAAAQLADRIITAEADVVAATGNSQEAVQNAFNGIMKNNFSMMDNLQLGITPTKEGFQSLIDSVNAWNAANGDATNYTISNLADCQSALLDYIDMQGLSGYASNEAAETISGSAEMTKAAWSDFLTSLADSNTDSSESFNNLKESALTFVDNVSPKIKEVLGAFGPLPAIIAATTTAFVAYKAATVITGFITKLTAATEGQTIAQALLNTVMKANPIVLIITLVAGLVAAFITLWKTNDGFREAITKAWDAIKNGVSTAVHAIADFFKVKIPNAIISAVAWFYKIQQKFQNLGKNIVEGIWNGIKNMAGWIKDKVSGFFSGIVDGVKGLLGIHSPSRVFADIGSNMAKGVGVGWNSEFGSIRDEIENGMQFSPVNISTRYSAGIDGYASESNAVLGDILNAVKAGQTIVMDKREFGRTVRQYA